MPILGCLRNSRLANAARAQTVLDNPGIDLVYFTAISWSPDPGANAPKITKYILLTVYLRLKFYLRAGIQHLQLPESNRCKQDVVIREDVPI